MKTPTYSITRAEAELSNRLRFWMESILEESEFRIIAHGYGLFGFPLMTLERLEQQTGVSKDVLRSVRASAHRKLQRKKLSEQEP